MSASPASMKMHETLIIHPSDIIHWIEGSGRQTEKQTTSEGHWMLELEPPSPSKPELAKVSITKKANSAVIWRDSLKTGTPLSVVKKYFEVTEADLAHPHEDSYRIEGEIKDEKGRYNPRKFVIKAAGNFQSDKHLIKRYRSPLGTRLGSFGGIEGHLAYLDESPVSWALVTCEVTLQNGAGKTQFLVQADIEGDFRMAFSGLPPLTLGSDSYSAELTIQSVKTLSGAVISDPDDDNFTQMKIKKLPGDVPVEKLNITVKPRKIVRFGKLLLDE